MVSLKLFRLGLNYGENIFLNPKTPKTMFFCSSQFWQVSAIIWGESSNFSFEPAHVEYSYLCTGVNNHKIKFVIYPVAPKTELNYTQNAFATIFNSQNFDALTRKNYDYLTKIRSHRDAVAHF